MHYYCSPHYEIYVEKDNISSTNVSLSVIINFSIESFSILPAFPTLGEVDDEMVGIDRRL